MASAALQFNQKPIPIYRKKVKELTALVTDHSPRFRRIALAHLGNVADAEDAFQDALLAAFTHVAQFRGQAKMSTWFTSIVVNSARMKLRRRSLQFRVILEGTGQERNFSLADFAVDTRPGPEEAYRRREISEILSEATSRLSPTLLRTFELRDLYGLNIRETATLLGVPSGTVKARTARARSKLREIMGRALKPVSPRQMGSSLLRVSCQGGGSLARHRF